MHSFRRTATLIAVASQLTVSLAGQNPPPDTALRRQQRSLDSLVAVIRGLQARIDSMDRARARGDSTGGDELATLRAAAAAAAGDSAAQAPQPRQARLGQNALNPEISVTGDLRGYWYRPGPQQDNFTPREFEFGFQSALDPYSVAKIFVSVEGGEVSVEEGYAYWTGLPGHGRIDVGRFRQDFGELNRWHLHALPEDEYPLVVQRYASEDGLAGTGVSLYWPLPFSGRAGTYELYVQGTQGSNDVLFAGGRRPSLLSKLSGFWQISRSTYAMVSVSGLYGTNPDTSLTTTAGALAARFSWRPPQAGTRSEVTLRGELWALHRRFELAGPAGLDRTRLGGYVDGLWRFNARWIFAVRGDWVQSPDPGPLAHEWAVTPSLTFWQSEFVYLRALWAHARDIAGATTDRLTLQAVFAMGPHKHELF